MKNNIGWNRLCQIKPVTFRAADLSIESLRKVKSTARYSLALDRTQDQLQVLKRCVIAQYAEEYVATWMEGFINHGSEDTDDPLSYAYDVLSNIKYTGMRIEVKTHQSNSSYMTVNTQHKPPYEGHKGVNIRPFLELGVADVLIAFDALELSEGVWKLTPTLLCDPVAMRHPKVVLKSKFSGFYVNPRISDQVKKGLNIFTF